METGKGHDRKFTVCLYEFLGQVFFMYAVLVSGGSGSDKWGVTGPLALFAVVNIFGGVSGGHFNPAVTLGVYVREAKWAHNFIFLVMIIASQIAGALVGMLLAFLVLRIQVDGAYDVLPANVPLLLPSTMTKEVIDAAGKDTTGSLILEENFTSFYMEVVCTFVFVLFILHVTGKNTGVPDMGVYGVPAICLVLWALCNVDYFTGASFNPALAIGSTVFQEWLYPVNPSNVMMHYLPMYVGGASLGGILAGVFYHAHASNFPSKDQSVVHAHAVNDAGSHKSM